MVKRFFTQEQYDALQDAVKDYEIMMLPKGRNTHFASQKSDMVVIEDLYRAILRNYDLPQNIFEASSAGWLVKVEKPFKVTVEWSPKNPENFGIMNYVKK